MLVEGRGKIGGMRPQERKVVSRWRTERGEIKTSARDKAGRQQIQKAAISKMKAKCEDTVTQGASAGWN